MARDETIEGTLIDISEVNSINKIEGKFIAVETVFTLCENMGRGNARIRQELRYRGLILPDSIGNKLVLTIEADKNQKSIKKGQGTVFCSFDQLSFYLLHNRNDVNPLDGYGRVLLHRFSHHNRKES